MVLCVFLVAACFFDYTDRRIPNKLLAVMLTAGMIRAGYLGEALGVFGFLGKLLLVICLLYPFFKIATLGGGDVKLFGICAGFLPANKVFLFLFLSLLFAALISVIHFIRKKDVKERLGYFMSYMSGVVKSGKWQLYLEEKADRYTAGVCMAGPMLCSALLYLGGVY